MQQKPLTHVFVTVPEGRLVPVPPSEMAASDHLAPGKVYVAPWSSWTRRRRNAGDLVLANKGGTAVETPEEARAPSNAKLEGDGTLAKDQRSDEEINAEAEKKTAATEAAAKAAADVEARRNHSTPASTPGEER